MKQESLGGNERLVLNKTSVQTRDHASEGSLDSSTEPAWSLRQAYHELDEVPVRELDLFESVEMNLAQLDEMQSRLRFMMKEVRYLLKL